MERILIDDFSEIIIGRGRPQPLLSPRPERRRIAVLSQEGAAEVATGVNRQSESEGLQVFLRMLPDGDAAKTIAVADETYEWLAQCGISRGDTVIGVGGGAATDFAGFIAGTWLRGVEAVYVSTTLLGAVDAAVGGKTGLNLRGKNLVGLFRHPSRVVVDIDVLDRLPEDLKIEGLAEAVKAGFIADIGLLDLLEADGLNADLDEVVKRAVRVKVDVVRDDFEESGRRAILNYGHTIGHGIEMATGLSHGHSVAVGMVAAGAISEARLGFRAADRQLALIEKLGLPTRSPAADPALVRRLIGLDKKHDARGLKMVLLEEFGRPRLVYVDDSDIGLGFEAIGLS